MTHTSTHTDSTDSLFIASIKALNDAGFNQPNGNAEKSVALVFVANQWVVVRYDPAKSSFYKREFYEMDKGYQMHKECFARPDTAVARYLQYIDEIGGIDNLEMNQNLRLFARNRD